MTTVTRRRVAIVTGGSAGLGLAIAQKLVSENIVTIITGRNEQRLAEAKQLLGTLAETRAIDATDFSGVPEVVGNIDKQYGGIDILINNAGINLKKDLTEVTDAEFQTIVATNLTGVFVVSREVAKVMIRQKGGSIVNISSMAAHYGIPRVTAYSASKAAIEGMTRSMAVDLSPSGIMVNCIAPGFIATAMSVKALDNDPARKSRVLARTPLGKLGSPEDVANMVAFLVSEQNKFVTGTVIPVDGGNSIGF